MAYCRQRLPFGLLMLFGIVLVLTSCTLEEPPAASDQIPSVPEGTCLIDPRIPLAPINPLVYGVNHGPWAVITDKTLPLAQDAGITMIRFPGGNWGDENDLQPYHMDQIVSLAQEMNSEISINVRLYDGTPEKAAALIRYANIENDYAIRYWAIGNEPTLYATSRKLTDYGVREFNEEWRAFAEAMKAVDESIILIGPELHQFGPNLESTPKDPYGLDWMGEFLEANGDLVDVVSIHRYPFPVGKGGRAATVQELLPTSQEWDEIIPYLRNLVIEKTGAELPIAVTEVNSHWSNAIGGEATPDSFINAVWWADALGRMITNKVDIVNYFSLQSQNSIGGYGLFSRTEPRPTYFIYKIYQDFGHMLVFAGCDDPNLGIYAATGLDGEVNVILVNLGSEDVTQSISVKGERTTLISVLQFDESNLLHDPDLATVDDSLDQLLIPGYSIMRMRFE